MLQFSNLLKEWRSHRRMSQLSLAMEAGVSSRHISFLETGRSRPSAEMILHLSDILEVPVDAQNQMLKSAGFASRYANTPLKDSGMKVIHQAITRMLDKHEPYPGLVLDRKWNAVKLNDAATRLLSPLGLTVGDSFLSLLVDPMMQTVIENWPEVAHYTMLRLRAESLAAGGIAELDEAVQTLSRSARASGPPTSTPTVPAIYRMGDVRLSLFGTITQFSTVNDETLADLKVELLYPADSESDDLLTAMQ